MTYVPFAVLLTIGLIFLTVLGEIKPQWQKKLGIVNAVLALIGTLVLLIVRFVSDNSIHGSGHDEQLIEWADDMFSIYFQITLPVFFVLLGITLLASVIAIFDDKQRQGFNAKVRIMLSCASSVILLIIAPFYGFMTANDSIPLYTYICWCGVGQALVMRLMFITEYFARSRRNVKKS